jgi:hypothetical protein
MNVWVNHWVGQATLLIYLCALVMVSSLVLGGGGRDVISDPILQALAIPRSESERFITGSISLFIVGNWNRQLSGSTAIGLGAIHHGENQPDGQNHGENQPEGQNQEYAVSHPAMPYVIGAGVVGGQLESA